MNYQIDFVSYLIIKITIYSHLNMIDYLLNNIY